MTGVAPAVARIRRWLDPLRPGIGIVLGSGLGGLTRDVQAPQRLPYSEIPGFPVTGVDGHGGELVAGELAGRAVLVQSGRFHLYEGHDPQIVALPVRVFAELGIETLVLTNAAGGLRPGLKVPSLMLIADHLNLMWRNPIVGPVIKGEQRFPDMSGPYDRALRSMAREVALTERVPLEEGVYAGMLGPSYETPAEIRMLHRIGADAVGMSTVPEVIAARARGMRVLAISTITNLAAGISPTRLTHEEVLESGKQVTAQVERLLRGLVKRL